MDTRKLRIATGTLSLYIAFIFVQSLFFKFTDSPETQHIFGTLNTWALSLGLPGVFARSGIFSQYVIGSAELVAAVLLLAGLLSGRALLQGAGALLSLGVISGAIFFHLFTPLGVVVVNSDGSRDGGELFILACGVWLASAAILLLRRRAILASLPGRRAAGKAMA
ncbi:MAG: hypothetical protein KIT36_03775 [Alphaproteobacteria bacterium]|nr:hypothetical protein [Alphaproteobacteria bacterium]